MEFAHRSVMAREVIEHLVRGAGGVYVDGTMGGGGHTAGILKASSPDGKVIGIDLDEDALAAASKLLASYGSRVTLVRGNYKDVKTILGEVGIGDADGVVLDLGVSSYQLEEPERGFSFRFDAKLDMRMDRRQRKTAGDLVNGLDVRELARIFSAYGEEKNALRIARAIDRTRKVKPIETTGELVDVILGAAGRPRDSRIHPATRVFQALRIAVNDELENLEEGLKECVGCLKSGGRIAVISFHSLEDRIVKKTFRDLATACVCPPKMPLCVCGRSPVLRLLTRKALKPSEDEVNENPRARSAKLRVAEKL